MRHAFMEQISERLAAHDVATLRWEFLYMSAGKPRPDTAAVAEASVRRVWKAARAHADLPMFAGQPELGLGPGLIVGSAEQGVHPFPQGRVELAGERPEAGGPGVDEVDEARAFQG